MPLRQDLEKDITVRALIERQRRLSGSQNPFERLVGTLFAAGTLDIRLAKLTDHQVGQLMFDHVENFASILHPESAICQHATRRLFRSSGGRFTTADIEKQRQRPACPKCGNEMFFHFGIDEPDSLQCVLLICGYKEAIPTVKESPSE
jgi:hypothetical protein